MVQYIYLDETVCVPSDKKDARPHEILSLPNLPVKWRNKQDLRDFFDEVLDGTGCEIVAHAARCFENMQYGDEMDTYEKTHREFEHGDACFINCKLTFKDMKTTIAASKIIHKRTTYRSYPCAPRDMPRAEYRDLLMRMCE